MIANSKRKFDISTSYEQKEALLCYFMIVPSEIADSRRGSLYIKYRKIDPEAKILSPDGDIQRILNLMKHDVFLFLWEEKATKFRSTDNKR